MAKPPLWLQISPRSLELVQLSNVLPSKSLISSPVYTGFVDPQNLDGSGDGRTGCVDEQVLEPPHVAIN